MKTADLKDFPLDMRMSYSEFMKCHSLLSKGKNDKVLKILIEKCLATPEEAQQWIISKEQLISDYNTLKSAISGVIWCKIGIIALVIFSIIQIIRLFF
jgi:16S rRNA C1402 N4-methylase RsmH